MTFIRPLLLTLLTCLALINPLKEQYIPEHSVYLVYQTLLNTPTKLRILQKGSKERQKEENLFCYSLLVSVVVVQKPYRHFTPWQTTVQHQ